MDLPKTFVKSNLILFTAFKNHISKDRKTKCWIWTGNTNGSYGIMQFKNPRKNVGAHRVSYLLYKGEISKGLSVCHKCDNPLCVNPKHLWLGTQQQNIQDMVKKGRRVQPNVAGELNGRCKLSGKEVTEIRSILKDGASIIDVSHLYRVAKTTVSAIKLRRLWKHIS